MTLSRSGFLAFLIITFAASHPMRAFAQTQEVIYTNRVPVYIGDLIDEDNAVLYSQNAAKLCARLNAAIPLELEKGKEAEHASNCIFHIVRFADLPNGTPPAGGTQSIDVQTIPQAKNNWYVYSNDHFWSLEDLKQSKRLFGAAHVSFFFVFINRALGSTSSVTNISVSSNMLTVVANNTFKPGAVVRFSNVKTSTFLNGKVVTISSATATGFTAKFNNADVASGADSGDISLVITPSAAPPSDTPGTDSDCSLPELPATGADGYYASYQIDVARKISANVEHLFALLKAEGLQTPSETQKTADLNKAPSALPAQPSEIVLFALRAPTNLKETSCADLSARKKKSSGVAAPVNCTPKLRLLAATHVNNEKSANGGNPGTDTKCHRPDAIFGGGTIDVAYQPADIKISGSLNKGDTTVAINKDPYIVDNEGRYFVDFSVPLTIKKLGEVQYQDTAGVFSPANVNSTNAFMAIDGFYPAVDVKSNNWTRWPHPIAGVAFAKQPLNKILLAGAWGPYFSEVYAGVAFIKEPRVGPRSSNCNASGGTTGASTDPYGVHYCPQFSIGLNLSVTGVASKLGSPK